jgi:uncharacterized lipoprotein YddW (UPF0748 family)
MFAPGRHEDPRALPPLVAAAAGALVLAASLGAVPASQKVADPEVRALSVTCSSLTSPAAVSAMVKSADAGRFNTLLVEVRSRGDAYFDSPLEPRAAALASQPASFDPLAATLSLAHARGLRVHASVSVALVAGPTDLPSSRAHLVNRHPEWLMVPRALARDLGLLDARSHLYMDRLLRWTRAQGDDVQGLYASPVQDDAVDAMVAVVADLAARYPVDGIHLDDIRYPSDEFDYSRTSLEAFKADLLSSLAPQARRQQERATGADLAAWPDAFPGRWRDFRREHLTALVARLRDAVRARRPDAVFSAAVDSDPPDASSRHLQDWGGWLRRQLLDVVCPVAHETDGAAFEAKIAAARQIAGETPVWVGIGAFQLSAAETVEHIRTARRLGARGVVISSYDSLMSQPRGLEFLAEVARSAFTP